MTLPQLITEDQEAAAEVDLGTVTGEGGASGLCFSYLFWLWCIFGFWRHILKN